MYESGWQMLEGGFESPATREDFLTALANVDTILVRATMTEEDTESTLLSSESMAMLRASSSSALRRFLLAPCLKGPLRRRLEDLDEEVSSEGRSRSYMEKSLALHSLGDSLRKPPGTFML